MAEEEEMIQNMSAAMSPQHADIFGNPSQDSVSYSEIAQTSFTKHF